MATPLCLKWKLFRGGCLINAPYNVSDLWRRKTFLQKHNSLVVLS